MQFLDSIKVCFTKYFDFKGRASRSEFWWFQLFICASLLVLTVIENALAGGSTPSITFTIIVDLFALAVVAPSITVAIRRLRDVDKSGWWYLIGFIPVIGFLILLYWYIQPGTAGSNQFGN